MKPVLRLLLGEGALAAWIVQGGQLRQLGLFPETAAGTADFARFLSRQAASGHLLLLDHGEPQLLAESLPATGFLTQRRMLDLRLERLHPDTRWRCSYPLPGSAGAGRRFAFLALAESPGLQGWLNCLADASIRLRGIHCPPLLLAAFIARRHRLPARLLVISQHDRGAQLCLLQHGRPAALAPAMPSEQIPAAIAGCQRFNPPPGAGEYTPDPLCLLGSADWQAHLTLPEPALRIITGHSNSSLDLLALPAWRWPRLRFPKPPLPHQSQRTIARGLWLAGAAASLGGLSLALASQSRQEAVNAAIERSHGQLRALEREMRKMEASAVRLGTTAAQLPQLAADRPGLAARSAAFAERLQQLSRALDATPDVELDAVHWTTPDNNTATADSWQIQVSAHLSPTATDMQPPALQQLGEQLRRHTDIRAEISSSPGNPALSLNLTAARQ